MWDTLFKTAAKQVKSTAPATAGTTGRTSHTRNATGKGKTKPKVKNTKGMERNSGPAINPSGGATATGSVGTSAMGTVTSSPSLAAVAPMPKNGF